MSLASRTSTAIAMRFKIFALLYWMDWCTLQAYLWEYRSIMEPFIHDKHMQQKSMTIGNSQLSKTGNESCLLHCTVTSIEEKVFTFKHGLNIGWSIYRLLIIRLQVQWINGNSCYKRSTQQAVLLAECSIRESFLISSVECPKCSWELYMQYNLCIMDTLRLFISVLIQYQGVPDNPGQFTSTC